MTAASRSLRSRLLRWVIIAVIAVFAWFALEGLVGRVDWRGVADAFSGLPLWVLAPLLLVLLVRQLLNAVPLVYYVPGLGVVRSALSDTTANLVATFTPPPGDIVLRVAMFRSWRLDPVAGMTGVTLNSAKFYAIRFVAPVLGLILLGGYGATRRQWLLALACALIAFVLLGGLVLMLRSDAMARWLGRTAGRVVRRFRKGTDPEAWAAALVTLRATAADAVRRGLLPSMVALVGMVLADATILAVAVRAVGVPAADLPLLEIYAALLLIYPLTLLPLFGLGVLDAVLVAALTTAAGVALEADLIAAAVIWRVVTIVGTLALGLLTLAIWRLTTRGTTPDLAADPAPDIPPGALPTDHRRPS
jgi:hypothetical protein